MAGMDDYAKVCKMTVFDRSGDRVLVPFDSTMLGNLSVGMPTNLLCYARDRLQVTIKCRFDVGDLYFDALTRKWLKGTRQVFRELPPLEW